MNNERNISDSETCVQNPTLLTEPCTEESEKERALKIATEIKNRNIQMAFNFFSLMYPDSTTQRYSYLWVKRGEEKETQKTIPFQVSDKDELRKMAEVAVQYDEEGYDVYFGICTTDSLVTNEHKRVTKSEVTGKPCLWTDIDTEGGKHTNTEKKKYPPDFDTAKSFLPLQPSLLVNSGYGLHGYWLLEPAQTINDQNRAEAEQLNKDVLSVIRQNAGGFSHAVDHVQDLARVLRVPGTHNYKLGKENAPLVRLVKIDDVKYDVSRLRADIDKLLATIPKEKKSKSKRKKSKSAATSTDLDIGISENLSDDEIIKRICESKQGSKFEKLFYEGDISDYEDDESRADMALMNILPFWTNGNSAQMERIFGRSALAQRDKWTEREDYRQRTIQSALEAWDGNAFSLNYRHENINTLVLDRSDSGKILPTIENFVTIMTEDSQLAGLIVDDIFTGKTVKTKAPPWGSNHDIGKAWSDKDDAQLRYYISVNYSLRAPQLLADAIIVAADQNSVHPVQDYLNSLPQWDGTERAATFFVNILGVEDNEYTRSITLHWLKAAVKRVMIPGCKFDYCLVLAGAQGIGKTTALEKLGVNWFNNSIDNINGKDALEQLLGSWIVELGEMQATKKADNEAIKNFISRNSDKVRLPYARRAQEFPRQCVFSATTNDSEPLKDKTGGRRFWILKSNATSETTSQRLDILSDDYIAQIWAEIYHLYNEEMSTTDKVNLLPPPEILAEAAKLQENFTEGGEIKALIENYLNTPIPTPEFWDNFTKEEKRNFILRHILPYRFRDMYVTVQRNIVCSAEIAYELFEVEQLNKDKMALREINSIMANLKGWHKESNRSIRMGPYGCQKNVYVRNEIVTPS